MCTLVESRKAVHELIEPLIEKLNLTNYKVELTSGSDKGDGYLGEITTVTVYGQNKLNENEELKLVVKSATVNDETRRFAPINKVYRREAYMYTTVFPQLEKFQREKSISNLFNCIPKCYNTSLDENAEALVFNNLRCDGYDTWNRKIPMNEEHLVMGLKEYGRFHAVSFALRDQKPELFEKITSCMTDMFTYFIKLSSFEKACSTAIQNLREKFEDLGYSDLSEKLKVFEGNVEEITVGCCRKEAEHSVILHGDCHSNNVMFKYKDPEHSTPSAICILDWQLSRIGPPVLDVSYYFYACATKSALGRLNEYLTIYYESFSSFLKELGSNPEELYSFNYFMTQWRKYSKFSLMFGIMVLRLLMSDKEETPNLTDDSITNALKSTFRNEKAYIERMKFIVQHFVDNKFI